MKKLSITYSRLQGIKKGLENYTEIERPPIRGNGNNIKSKYYPYEAIEYFDEYNSLIKDLKLELPELYDSLIERKIDNEPRKGNLINDSSMNILKMDIEKIFAIKNANEILIQQPINQVELAQIYLEKIFTKFHRVAQEIRDRYSDRDTLVIKDEYDVQDLLNGMLRLFFDDVRPEDYSPSSAGSNSRIDFILKTEKIGIEVKMTNKNLKDNKLGEQLLVDIGRYKDHPDCSKLFIFVYDKEDLIRNKHGIKRDIESHSIPEFPIKFYISPS